MDILHILYNRDEMHKPMRLTRLPLDLVQLVYAWYFPFVLAELRARGVSRGDAYVVTTLLISTGPVGSPAQTHAYTVTRFRALHARMWKRVDMVLQEIRSSSTR